MSEQTGAARADEAGAVEAGQFRRVEHRVRSDDLAAAFGSGDVPVLATPRALAWAEEATMMAIAGKLQPGTTSVGLRVSLDHIAPATVGTKVFAEATVEKVDGRRITFEVKLEDERGQLLAIGRVIRVVLKLEKFLGRLEAGVAKPATTGQIPILPSRE